MECSPLNWSKNLIGFALFWDQKQIKILISSSNACFNIYSPICDFIFLFFLCFPNNGHLSVNWKGDKWSMRYPEKPVSVLKKFLPLKHEQGTMKISSLDESIHLLKSQNKSLRLTSNCTTKNDPGIEDL